MKLNTVIKYCLSASLVLLTSNLVHAQNEEVDLVALLNIVPTTPTSINLSSNQSVLFQYTLTNQSIARTFAMRTLAGVTPLSALPGECAVTAANGFHTVSLGANQSCVLTLAINGSQINPAAINNQFPEFCPFINGQSVPFSCSYPCQPITLTLVPPAPQLAYVVSGGSGPSSGDAKITICDVTSTGSFTGCVDSTDPAFENLTGIAVNQTGNRIYVADGSGGNVYVCSVAAKALTGCNATNFPIGLPQSKWIALNQANTKAYISREIFGAPVVTECSINQTNGDLTSCTDHSGNTNPLLQFTTPIEGIALNRNDSQLYVVSGDSLFQCPITTFECNKVVTLPGILNGAIGLFAAKFGDYVKITKPGDVVQCTTTNGVVGNCANLGTVGLTGINTGIDMTETNGNTYVNNTTSNTTDLCFGNICASQVLNPTNPQGIAIRAH